MTLGILAAAFAFAAALCKVFDSKKTEDKIVDRVMKKISKK